jgi:hypothetical protein
VALGAERPHVQPDGGGAWAAVVDEGDGALKQIFRVGTGVSGVVDERGRLFFFVFEQDGGGGGFVGNGLRANFYGVIGYGSFHFGGRRRGLGGLFLFDGLGFFFVGFLGAEVPRRCGKQEQTHQENRT